MPHAFLIIITFWLAAAFAIFLILDLGNPFEGRIVVSGDPMRVALAHLGQ